jgi:hypothetical protein
VPRSNYPDYVNFLERVTNSRVERCSFSDVIAAGWNSNWDQVIKGPNTTVSQSGGNGIIVASTTANEETILRYKRFFAGSLCLRHKATLSQRIAQNNFFVELVDVVGDGLACVINSAVSITVTIPDDGPVFSDKNVGQSLNVGGIVGAAGIPGRYAIASVDSTGKRVTITVAGWPVSGNCTVSLFGLNFYRMLYDGTTATQLKFDTGRNGWASGDTTASINTTASPVVTAVVNEDYNVGLLDTTANSTTWTQRAQRTENIPDADVQLVLQVRVLNGTSNPASTTTFTLGFISMECYDPTAVRLGSQAGFNGSSAPSAPMNLVQLAGNGISTGNGTSGTGTLRVAIVSDQTTNTNPLLVGGTGSTSIGKARDGAAGGTDTVVPTAAIRRDIPTAVTPAAGDYETPQLSAKGALWVAMQGAPSSSHTVCAATNNATNSKGSAGILHDISASNINAAFRYLKIYDKATAPTIGTDTPKRVVPLPPNSSIQQTVDLECTAGIGWGLVTGIANSDNTAPAANENIVGLSWF